MKSKFKKSTAWLLTLAMLLTMLPSFTFTAFAADATTLNIADGSIVLTESDGNKYYQQGSNAADPYTGEITITGTSNANSITVQSGEHNVVLSGLNISAAAPFDISAGATVNLYLDGTNMLTATAEENAGLHVPSGATLNIYEKSVGGSLTAIGNTCSAGIGSRNTKPSMTDVGSGNITIFSGTITAQGCEHGAGIGGASYSSGNNIAIHGGTVTATTVRSDTYQGGAAGIGGGLYGSANVTITGGFVTATGLEASAGIGGGGIASGVKVTISGGTVIATGGSGAAYSIGEGYIPNTGDGIVTITGGSVLASKPNKGEAIQNATNGSSAVSVQELAIPDGYDISDLYIKDGNNQSYNYGLKDVQPIDGKVYLYLPEGVTASTECPHTPDNEIGQTCQGYWCTECESWYGEPAAHMMDPSTGKCKYDCGTQMAVASVTKGGTTVYYTDLYQALPAVSTATAADNAVIKLEADFNGTVSITGGVFTFDLNGHGVQCEGFGLHIQNAIVTLTDTRENGSITATGNAVVAIGGSLVIEDGIITSTNSRGVEIQNNCVLTITGGTITGVERGVVAYGGIMTITGGIIEATGAEGIGVETTSCDAVITGGSISGNTDISGDLVLKLADGKTTGAEFPGGLKSNWHLSGYLGEGMAFWQGDKMIVLSEEQTEITGGNVVVKKVCDHEYEATDNGDGTHDKVCDMCGYVVDSEPHTIENHVCTACGAMEIVVSFNAGDYEWKTGDQIRLLRWKNDQHVNFFLTAEVTEDGTVTWTPDKKLYWDGKGEHTLVASCPNMNLLFQNFQIPEDQSDLQKLKKADCMNAMWSGNPTTDPITLNLKHRLAKVTVNYEVAEGVTISKAEVYTLTQYMFFDVYTLERKDVAWEEGYDLWINSYLDGNRFTAFVSPDAYAADGNFIKITLSDGSVREVKMNKAVTFEEGAEYTYTVVITADGAYLTCADECTFEYTDNEDGLTHSKTCSKCGYVAASEAHSGGTATCTEQAKCQHCGASYGELAAHTPDTNGKCTVENCGYQYAAKVGDTFYETIHKSLRAAEGINGCTVTLLDDITIAPGNTAPYVNKGTFTLDLNGNTISSNASTLQVVNTANLTIKDGIGGGKIVSTNSNAIYQTGGQITIESGTFEGSLDGVFLSGSSTLTVKGGTFNGSRAMITGFGSDCVIDLTNIDPAGFTLKNNGEGTFTPSLPSGYAMVNGSGTVVTSLSAEESATVKASLENATVTLDQTTFTYNGQPQQPTVTVNLNGKTLTEGTDYRVFYSWARIMENGKPTKWFGDHTSSADCINAGDGYYAVVIGLGNYYTKDAFTLYANFRINPKTVTEPTFADLKETYLHTGSAIEPAFTLMDGSAEIPASEYTVAYSDNTAVGTATITITDQTGGNYTVNGTKTFKIVVHVHEWSYSASGDTITATCEGTIGECPVKTVTIKLNAPGNLTYDGNAKIVTVTQSPADVFADIPAVTYGASGNVNAGKHTASLTYGEKTATLEFTIAAATPTVAWNNTTASVEYTGSAASITAPTVTLANGETFNGTISYSYTGTSSGSGLPTNAGTYEITASIAAQGNYTAATSMNKLTLTITAKNIAAADIAVNGVNASYTYTGNPIQPTVTSVTADGKTLDSNEYEVTYGTNTTVAQGGSVIVKLKGNYSGEKTVTFTILASDQADFSISGATTAVYGGNSIELTATGGSGTGAITWEITSGDQFASIDQNGVVTIKGAGTVTVKATKAADGNYKEKVDTHQITISKATVSASKFSYSAPSDLVYSKTAKAATVTGDAAYGAITIKYYSDSSLTTVVQPINVGIYYVGITTAGGSNYEAVTAPMYVGSFTITARTVTVTAEANTMQYGDDIPELTYTHNLIAGDKFTGSLETEATKTSDVGEYDITIGDLANSNYTISFTGAKLTITKANGPVAPTVTGSYVDNGMTYTYTVDPINGAEYSKDGTTWQDSNVFENLVAGQKYTFYARIKETKNVMAGAIGTSAEVDLSKLPGKGTVTIADWTFGEDAKAPVTNSTTGNTVDSYLYESTDGKGYSSANAPTNAGEYKLTVTFKGTVTHNGTTAYDTFTIAKATPVVDVPTGLKATYGDTLADVQLPTGWAWKDAGTTEVGNAGENSFTVIYTKDDSGNYNTVEKTVTITVAPKVVTATVTVVGENFIFNGSEQKPGVTVKDGENTIPESEYTVTYANNTNAGTATVTITDKDGGNYTVTGETTFAIAKKASSALSGVEREFMRTIATTGNEIDVEAMLPDDHGTVTYTITSNGYTVLENVAVDANGKLVFDTKTSAAAASDTITVKVEMQNYTDVTLTVSVILNDKAPQEITGVTAQTDLIYNGEAQKGYTGTPASEKYTGTYEITYTGRDNSYNSSLAPTNAGDYTVTFKIPDSDLYYSGNVSINFTIGKAQATVTADDKEAYIGSRMPELTYKVSGLIGNDTISVELSCDANMNRAGETPIVVTATDPNGNYEITAINGTLTVEYFPYIPPIITPTYPPVVDGGDNGDVDVSPKNPEKGDTVVITPDPDAGYEVDEIIVTDKNGNPITVFDNGDGTYSFKQPSGKVNIEVTFKEIIKVCPGDKTCPMYGYTDLDMTAWYHDGVHFCIENKLMNGTSTTTFAPGATTSRAMIVTILWRLAGEPVVNYAMSFEDVAADTWYTEAIRWAASEGIVNGYSDTAFGPNDNITREQLATILYRYEQKNGGGFKGMWMFRMDYVDLADVSDWAYEAMCWMNMNSIVNGKPGKVLDPKGNATRAEAATMLYRYCDVIGKDDEN